MQRDYVDVEKRDSTPSVRATITSSAVPPVDAGLVAQRSRRLDLRGARPAHRPAVDRDCGRLADAVQREHDRVDRLLPGDEAQRREVDDAVALEAHAPLEHLVRHAAFVELQRDRLGLSRRTGAG